MFRLRVHTSAIVPFGNISRDLTMQVLVTFLVI